VGSKNDEVRGLGTGAAKDWDAGCTELSEAASVAGPLPVAGSGEEHGCRTKAPSARESVERPPGRGEGLGATVAAEKERDLATGSSRISGGAEREIAGDDSDEGALATAAIFSAGHSGRDAL
jgi:hypothetical protein